MKTLTRLETERAFLALAHILTECSQQTQINTLGKGPRLAAARRAYRKLCEASYNA